MELPDPVAGCHWSPLSAGDLDDLLTLTQAIEYVDDAIRPLSENLLGLVRQAGGDMGERGVLLRDTFGAPVAFAWNHIDHDAARPTVWMTGGVHPAWRYHGIGTKAVRWQVDLGVESFQGGTGELSVLIDERSAVRISLFRDLGFTPRRWYFDMHHWFAGPGQDPPPPVIEGLMFVPLTDAYRERMRVAHNETFAETGAQRIEPQAWDALLARPTVRPDWSWIALDHERVVGYALNSGYDVDKGRDLAEGWTELLGVVPDWRGRGVSAALLSWSMTSFGNAHLHAAGVGIDTDRDPQALRDLLGRLGYEATEMLVRWGRDVG